MKIQSFIDHTLLKPQANPDAIRTLCKEAAEHEFYAVCVNPCYVSLCKEELKESNVNIASVIGFPLGAAATEIKAAETRQAVADGADEIDMVIQIGQLKAADYAYVKKDIAAVVKAAAGKLVKVIIETCLLSDEEKVKACQLSEAAGAQFVKTSTGFSTGGATVNDIKLMKKTVGGRLKVKASGGVKSYETAMKMIEAGAERIGTSSGIVIAEKK